MLIGISSVYKRSGLLYDKFAKHYGQNDDDVLFVKGTTLQFNSAFDRRIIERDVARDPERYNAEYHSVWR